jgi:hypothetical protein
MRGVFFRSFTNNAGKAGSAASLIDAVHASSTAPVPFFDKPAISGKQRFWDGRACLVQDIRKLAGSILDEPPDAAGYAAYVTTENPVDSGARQRPARFVRFNPSIQPVLSGGSWTAPPGITCDALRALMNLPAALMTKQAVAIVKELGRKWIEGVVPNEPIQRGENLECVIGNATFKAGRDHWLMLAAG